MKITFMSVVPTLKCVFFMLISAKMTLMRSFSDSWVSFHTHKYFFHTYECQNHTLTVTLLRVNFSNTLRIVDFIDFLLCTSTIFFNSFICIKTDWVMENSCLVAILNFSAILLSLNTNFFSNFAIYKAIKKSENIFFKYFHYFIMSL
jgi:hypothetical protein